MSEVLDHQLQLRALATAIERVCNLNCDLRSAAPTVFDAVSVPSMSVHCCLFLSAFFCNRASFRSRVGRRLQRCVLASGASACTRLARLRRVHVCVGDVRAIGAPRGAERRDVGDAQMLRQQKGARVGR